MDELLDNFDPRFLFVLVIVGIQILDWFFKKVVRRNKVEPEQEFQDFGEPTDERKMSPQETLEEQFEKARREIQRRQTADPERKTPPPLPGSPNSPQQPRPASHSQNGPLPPGFGEPSQANPLQQKVKRPKLTKAEQEALARLQSRDHKQGQARSPRSKSQSWKALLDSPQAARQAMILQEVLGPPVGQQERR